MLDEVDKAIATERRLQADKSSHKYFQLPLVEIVDV
jgi:hypothetical protein